MGVVRSRLLVGRDEELAALREARALADSGRPALVVGDGEAGIGKTRLVRELADAVTDTDPAAAVATGHGVNLAVGTVLYGAAARLLALLSRDRLLCLFVEDRHWADPSSLDLLLFLVKAARPGRLLVVATVRP